MTAKSQEWTSRKNDQFDQTHEYAGPVQSTRTLINEVRKKKRDGIFTPKKVITQAVEEPVNRKLLVNRQAIEPTRKYTTNNHSGVWEMSKADGRYMWSDTGSFVFGSRGDVIKIHNPDAYNLEGPTLFKPMTSTARAPSSH